MLKAQEGTIKHGMLTVMIRRWHVLGNDKPGAWYRRQKLRKSVLGIEVVVFRIEGEKQRGWVLDRSPTSPTWLLKSARMMTKIVWRGGIWTRTNFLQYDIWLDNRLQQDRLSAGRKPQINRVLQESYSLQVGIGSREGIDITSLS